MYVYIHINNVKQYDAFVSKYGLEMKKKSRNQK
jgi:hypothetical protein